ELPGNPLGLGKDELVFEKTDGAHTAALIANIGGTSLCTVDVAGGFGRELTQQGPDAMAAFAGDWLASLFGEQIKSAIRRTQVTQWNSAPWTLGAFAAASPGDDAHKVLMDPIRERVWFAGDAAHETLWGTVGGAWESGVRAAEAALRKMGALKDTEPQASAPPPRHPPPSRTRATRMNRPRALIAWSSGKDSAWSLHEVRRAGDYEVVGALTTVTDSFKRVSMHGVREELLMAQLEAAELTPILIRIPYPCSNEVYEREMAAAVAAAKARGISHIIFGDLFLRDIRAYREQKLAGSGVTPVFPLWDRPTDALARDMIAGGTQAH